MKKWNIALAVFLIGAGTLTACSGKSDTLAPEKAETKAEWGLNFYENTTEKESEESKAEESSSENRILEAADGVMLMELEDMKLQAASPVNVRKGPGTNFEKLGGLASEQEVTMTGLCDNNWARILFEGETGYVSASYLTSPDGSVSLSELLEQVKAKVEESAKKSSDEETSEAETSEESSEEESSEEESSEEGSSEEESSEKESETESSQAVSEEDLAWATIDVNVRKGPGAKYETLGVLKQNDSVEVLDSSDVWWWKVKFEGKEAYISVQYLTTDKPE